MKKLNPLTMPLTGRRVIEASAGTGKTYTISKLYLRLLLGIDTPLDRPLRTNEILVVTFTNAATAELRGRIRDDIVKLRDQIIHGQVSSDYSDLFSACEHQFGKQKADEIWPPVLLLTTAARAMDSSEIFTIHSFSFRLLQQYAAYSSLPFGLNFSIDNTYFVRAVQDTWRSLVYGRPKADVALVRQCFSGPESLQSLLKSIIALENGQIKASSEDAQDLMNKIQSQEQSLKGLWQAHRDQVIQALSQMITDKVLNGRSWKPSVVKNLSISLDNWATGASSLDLSQAKKLLPSELESKLNKNKSLAINLKFSEALEAFLACFEQLKPSLIRYAQGKVKTQIRQLELRADELTADSVVQMCAKLITTLPENVLNEIRSSLPVALIDEFQDTDPHQYNSFSTLYSAHADDTALLMIGDPKQSIYRFRNADLAVYTAAKKQVSSPEGTFTMDKNWRSNEYVLQAIEHIFTQHQNPFFDDDIGFSKVSAGKKDAPVLTRNGINCAAMDIHLAPEEPTNLTEQDEAAAEYCAMQIANLLTPNNHYQLAGEPVAPRHIAVLTTTNQQQTAIKNALRRRGIASANREQRSVFDTEEAQCIASLLQAIAYPRNERAIRNFVGSSSLAFSANELNELFSSEETWSQWLSALERAHDLWRYQGPLMAANHILQSWALFDRIASTGHAARAMTNILQLLEIIQRQAQITRGIEGQLEWFEQQITNSEQSNTHQLRLESDDELIQIVTIHSSKGLEYPLVFLPFINRESTKSPTAPYVYHDGVQRWADFDDKAKEASRKETLQENLRLFYVALTRATSYIYLGLHALKPKGKSSKRSDSSVMALNYLLGLDPHDAESLRDRLNQLDKKLVRIVTLKDEATTFEKDTQTQRPQYTSFTGSICRTQSVTSYSALVRAKKYNELDAGDRGVEDEQFNTQVVSKTESKVDERFLLEKGAHVGNFLHYVFEHFELNTLGTDEARQKLQQQMLLNGIDLGDHEEHIAAYERWLIEAACTPIMGSISLRDIPADSWLAEMEFLLPLKGTLDASTLNKMVAPYIDFQLDFAPVSGHLVGHVDLIFEVNSRYFVADYKSNHLGDDYACYTPQLIESSMRHSGYTLQYLIYCVGLHRHLGIHMAGYDYDKHFGGVYYLYLRGMHPDYPNHGVYFDRPPLALIETLDQLFSEGTFNV